MSIKTFEVEFDFLTLAVVEIDQSVNTEDAIIAMVKFWMGWEDLVDENDGSFFKAWLQQLGRFIFLNRRQPTSKDEGWCDLDGSNGIKLTNWDSYIPEHNQFSVSLRNT